MHDLTGLVASVRDIVASHSLGTPGAYRRWNRQAAGQQRDLGLNPYGCADAANILYTIGWFPQDQAERAQWVATLRSLQDPQSGLFREATHHEIHTTAHCIAALELFDAAAQHPLTALAPYRDAAAMEQFLDKLDWRGSPWNQSHKGAGLYAAMVLSREVGAQWQDRYFAWLWDSTDPATGFLRKGCVVPVGNPPSLFPHLAGTFHYFFNHEYARRPLRYPDAMINTCLDMFARDSYPLGRDVGFAEVDWVYCVTRSLRQSGHRRDDCHAALEAFVGRYVSYLLGLDPATHDKLSDLHALFGALCCLAELQTALPGQIRTERPLKLVLDRRPFI